jgi:hypothetical protein
MWYQCIKVNINLSSLYMLSNIKVPLSHLLHQYTETSSVKLLIMFNFIASIARRLPNPMACVWILSHCDTTHSKLTRSSLRPLDIVASKQVFVSLAGSKHVCCFTVNHIITYEELLFGHAEGYAEDVFDEAHDEGGPNDVPANYEECADDSAGSRVSRCSRRV